MRAPGTLGEYVAAPGRHRSVVDPIAALLRFLRSCCANHSQHEISIDGATRCTHCVLDTLVLAIMDDAEAAAIRSVSPLGREVVTLTVAEGAVTADPTTAVISFGMLREGSGTVFETLCPYVNAFPSEEAYQRWAAATPDAVTVSMSVQQAWEFARDMLGPTAAVAQ
ncbi:MAG: hypothetical protein HS107_15475 [Thermoflexaceae bacterium]|nr:hypothetical protein [Thermoflexaceae bacterium]